ncbi:hypothetical protein PVAND_014577 [Polypedilum vanderplanki]|uniref:Timeless-like protein n=1 Tax=Polypedilum vanderplanki TaxID=319348 RepID=A0A9J6BA58_POLVA|nr:hypothetical protein PVAND_014577 [Polypedilum vanderplanki]
MSILLADIDATCSNLGYHDGNKYYIEDDTIQSLKHLIWILRRDNLDTHEYRRYIGHMKVVKTDLLPMLVCYCNNVDLSDVLLRLLVNLTNPAILFFRADLPKDNAGRRTYLDMVEISHSYKEAFGENREVWKSLAARLNKLLEIDVSDRMEEQNLIIERILVLTRNVLQVPTNVQYEKRVDNDMSVHDQILLALHESGMLEILLNSILSSRYENQFFLHSLEITYLIFRDQNVEMLAKSSLERSEAEKHADEQALVTARRIERERIMQQLPPARHSRFGGTYVYRNVKSISDKDLICHKPLERVFSNDLSRDKKKIKPNFRLIKDEDRYERQSAFQIRLLLREFCLKVLEFAFNNLVRQVRRVLERPSSEGSGHDQSYLLWAIRFFLQFNRLNDFKYEFVNEALSTGTIHWICNQIQHDADMVQNDKRMKINWNRRLQLGILAYREFLENIPVLEQQNDEEIKNLVMKLKSNVFYVIEYREIVIQLLLSYNENNFTRMYLRDLIDTANVYLKLMERFCQGSIMVQAKVKKNKTKKKKKKKEKIVEDQKSAEEKLQIRLAKLEAEWDSKISSNLSVVLANEINISDEEEIPKVNQDNDLPIAEQCKSNADNLLEFLENEEYEKAVILLRECRKIWSGEIFGFEGAQPEDELLTLKNLFVSSDNDKESAEDFWKSFNANDSEGENNDNEDEGNESYDDEEEEEETELKEVVMNFNDIEKRLLNPKIIRACTFVLQSWEKMSYREIKSAVTVLYRIAVNQKNPIMLMQAQLFRIFQQVVNSPNDNRYEELRKLAVYIVKQFVKVATKNPKIYAELLFFKSHRECYEIEFGYNEQWGSAESKSKAWTKAQEEQLRSLYMQNQESPQTDQDVIDWIVENLHDKSRNRRNVIKKLKELGLIFKAPTKKSNAAATNKNLFIKDEDDKLMELYDAHRLNENCLDKIMEVFNKKRSKKAVVKRMLQLGLIADESEILPARKKRNENYKREESEAQSDSERSEFSDSDDENEAPKKPTQFNGSNFNFNVNASQKLRNEVEETLKEAIQWIIESLNEAAEDFDEPSDEITDAIPLVPFTEAQKSALENQQFIELLKSINLIEPMENENYWKIPANMIPNELKERARMLNGGIIETLKKIESESEDEDAGDDLFSRLRAQHNALAYNNSDDDENHEKITKKQVKKLNTRFAKKLYHEIKFDHENLLLWLKNLIENKIMKKNDGNEIEAENDEQKEFLESEICEKFLNALSFEKIERKWKIPENLRVGDLKKRLKIFEDLENTGNDSENSDNEESLDSEKNSIKISSNASLKSVKKGAKKFQKISESSSGDEQRQNLSSDSENSNQTEMESKNRRRLLSSSDESTNFNDATLNSTKRSRKVSSDSDNSSIKSQSTNRTKSSTNRTRNLSTNLRKSKISNSNNIRSKRNESTDSKLSENSTKLSQKRQIESDSEDDSMIFIKKKKTKKQENSDEIAINTQELKQQLAELGESSDEDKDTNENVKGNKRKILDSSDDENEEISTNENEMNATNKLKKARRIIDSDDE